MIEWAEEGPFAIRERENFEKGPHIGWSGLMGKRIELFRLAPPKAGSLAVLATVIRNNFVRTVRFDASHPRLKAWLGGIPIKHNQALTLAEGNMAFILLAPLDPPGGQAEPLGPRFWASSGPQKDEEAWLAHIQRCRPYLEQALALSPESPAGRQAKAVLEASR
jgi:hypothetical protein